MAEAVVAAPAPTMAPLRRKLFAVAAFLLVALLLWYVDRLPSAVAVDDHPAWKAGRNDGLALYGLGGGQVLEFNGALGAGLGVRARAVRPAPAMVRALGLGDGGPAPLSWRGRTDPSGRIGFTVAGRRDDPEAGLALFATGGANIPQLRITALGAPLSVAMQATPGESDTVPPIALSLGDAEVGQPLATMTPVAFDLPPGGSMVLTFPSVAAMSGASFRLGTPDDADEIASNLPVDRMEIGRRRADGAGLARVAEAVCGADAGALLFRRLTPRTADCGGGDLAVESLAITPEQVAVGLSGSGFVTTPEGTVAAGLLTSAWNNKAVAALLTLAVGTLAAWVWKTVTGLGKP